MLPKVSKGFRAIFVAVMCVVCCLLYTSDAADEL